VILLEDRMMQFDYATLEGTATWAGVMAGPGPVAHSTD